MPSFNNILSLLSQQSGKRRKEWHIEVQVCKFTTLGIHGTFNLLSLSKSKAIEAMQCQENILAVRTMLAGHLNAKVILGQVYFLSRLGKTNDLKAKKKNAVFQEREARASSSTCTASVLLRPRSSRKSIKSSLHALIYFSRSVLSS